MQIKKQDGIHGNKRKCIEIWESVCLENETCHEKMEDYIIYWKNVVEKLDNPYAPTPHKPHLGFWPSTSYTMTDTSMFDAIQVDTTLQDDSSDPFYGIACDKPIESYDPYKYVFLGDFVFVHPLYIYRVYMGRTLIAMQLDRNHSQYGQF